ncbi:MAG TPA: TrkA family potassium uptake protein [Actinomycetes bacterium]|nr:TrkA family potassium uptake protein [Actinomycetes bacterium]
MHVVIMGCGRVGSELAARLEGRGHTVAVIDKREIAFRMLRFDFKGQKVHGYGFDEDILVEAGIKRAGAFAAVSNGDNSNIVAARLAREKFEVPTVVARIYDPRRAEIYQRLGIPTVATVKWTTDQVMRILIPDEIASDWKDPSEGVSLVTLVLPTSWAGWTVEQLESNGHRRVVAMTRIGRAGIPVPGTLLQEGDQLHLAVDEEGLEELRPMIIAGHRRPGGERGAPPEGTAESRGGAPMLASQEVRP